MSTKPPDAKVPILDMVIGMLINEVLCSIFEGFRNFRALVKINDLRILLFNE